MDEITEDALWSSNMQAHAQCGARGCPDKIVQINGEFYDNYIVSRWSDQWLAGDTTWVIALALPIPWEDGFQYSLPARSAHILNNYFYKDRTDIRFGIVDYDVNEDIKLTLGVHGPCFVILKDGQVYHAPVGKNNYVEMHEFIEDSQPNGKARFTIAVSGRITSVGKYVSYARKEVKAGQDFIVAHLQGWLTYNEAPDWAFSAFNWYKSLRSEMQMLVNILVLCYLLCVQYYFIRHMLCESCFREWKQLNDEVKESERNLDQKRAEYKAEMARRKENFEKRQRDRVNTAGRGSSRKAAEAEESKKTR